MGKSEMDVSREVMLMRIQAYTHTHTQVAAFMTHASLWLVHVLF